MSKLINVKHVSTIHGGDVLALDSHLLRKFKAFTLKHSDVVTVNSSVTRAKAEALSPATVSNLVLLPTGILAIPPLNQDEVLAVRTQLLPKSKEYLLLFVGRVNEEKGVKELIEATKILLDNGYSVHLAIVGRGHQEQQFKALAATLNVENAVTFVGWVDSSEIYHYYAAADIFVGPSKRADDGWIEAQGLTFVEAMLAGCKVVGTNSGGIPDAVIDGKTGWLAEPDNAISLSENIKKALDNDSTEITDTASAFAKDNYLVQNTVRRFLTSLKDVA